MAPLPAGSPYQCRHGGLCKAVNAYNCGPATARHFEDAVDAFYMTKGALDLQIVERGVILNYTRDIKASSRSRIRNISSPLDIELSGQNRADSERLAVDREGQCPVWGAVFDVCCRSGSEPVGVEVYQRVEVHLDRLCDTP